MTIRHLRIFTEVCSCGSVTGAAKKLYLAQPSVSLAIRELEEHYGVKLFDRIARRLDLTEAGARLLTYATHIISLFDDMERDVRQFDGQRVRVATSLTIGTCLLPELARRFAEIHPEIELQVMEAKSDELLQAILRDDISFYVIPRSQGELPVGLKAEPIYREQLLLVAEESMLTEDMFLDESCVSNLTEGKRKNRCVDLSKMSSLPFVMLKKGHAIRKKTDLVLRQYGIDPKIMIELSSCISAVQLAAAGLGVAIVPQRAIDALGGMERFNCYDFSVTPEFWSVNAVYKEDMYLGRAERFLIDLMKQKFNL